MKKLDFEALERQLNTVSAAQSKKLQGGSYGDFDLVGAGAQHEAAADGLATDLLGHDAAEDLLDNEIDLHDMHLMMINDDGEVEYFNCYTEEEDEEGNIIGEHNHEVETEEYMHMG